MIGYRGPINEKHMWGTKEQSREFNTHIQDGKPGLGRDRLKGGTDGFPHDMSVCFHISSGATAW